MKNFLVLIISLVFAQSGISQTNKVLLIGIDGCRPDAMQAAYTPNLDALMANGTYSLDALNTGITISGPGWSSLMTGVWPDKHGVTDNSFEGEDFLNYPHLFQRIEEYDSELSTVSICQWHPINNEIATSTADLIVNVDDHSDYVSEAAVIQLNDANPDALFLHFDDVDHAGHAYGFSASVLEYIESIETVDNAIGEVLSALYNRETYSVERWAIIVSTDHGGLGTSHGGNAIEERNIFMIVSGDDILNEEIVADSSLIISPPVLNCLEDSTELYFDTDAYVESSGSELFDFGSNEDFTIECRIRTNQSGDVAILTDKDWDSGYNPGWVFSFNFDGGPWKVNVGDGDNRVDVEGNDISDGEWHMLSATFDRDGMLTIYEDGLMVNEISMASIGDISASNQIFMGADINQNYGFTGYISETRIFNELVSPNAINEWACSHLDSSHPNYPYLVSQWAINEGTGSGLGNDGANALFTIAVGTDWESTTDTNSIWVKDYSGTPRQVDFMVSALEHLCIPIQENWDLDGEILATHCQEGPNNLDENQQEFSIFPNPATDQIQIKNLAASYFELFDELGKRVLATRISQDLEYINTSQLRSGFYEYQISRDGTIRSIGKISVVK